MQKHKIDIYTDGSCIGNPGPGGWGVIILTEDREVQIKGGELDTTNNRMEMSAIINALRWLKNEASIDETNTKDFLIKLHSDSNLLIHSGKMCRCILQPEKCWHRKKHAYKFILPRASRISARLKAFAQNQIF